MMGDQLLYLLGRCWRREDILRRFPALSYEEDSSRTEMIQRHPACL